MLDSHSCFDALSVPQTSNCDLIASFHSLTIREKVNRNRCGAIRDDGSPVRGWGNFTAWGHKEHGSHGCAQRDFLHLDDL